MQHDSLSSDFLLASLLSSYPTPDFAGAVLHLCETNSTSLPDSLQQLISHAATSEDFVESLRSGYIDIFDKGAGSVPLYETEYGRARAMVKGQELADLAGFYKAFGLDPSASKEMIDHICVELEFYALLLLKERALSDKGDVVGVSIVQDARKKFLADHLGRFAQEIAKQPKVNESAFFQAVFSWCGDLVAKECRLLDVEVAGAQWQASEGESEEMCCGSLGGRDNSVVQIGHT